METSDSECFESADEDFYSDDETQIERKQDAKGSTATDIVKKAEKLSVTDGDGKHKSPNKKEQVQTIKGDDRIETTAKGDSLQHDGLSRTECWEPGVNYDIDEDVDVPQEGKKTDKHQQSSDSSEQVDLDKSAAKHQIPPAVSSSRSDLGRTLTDKVGDKNSETEKDDTPPPIAICWEPDVDYKWQKQPYGTPPCAESKKQECDSDKHVEETPKKLNENDRVQKRPEFGILPLIETCWFPNVNNVQQPFQPHPAYLELMKKNEAAKNTDNEAISSAESTKKANDESEEDMWKDDEDWGAPDATTKQEKADNTDKEENMWDDDDEWEPVESLTHQQQPDNQKSNQNQTPSEDKSSWSSWGNWGLSSVISTATSLTTQVSQGITNVLESGIGAPDPVELARINKLEKEKAKQITSEEMAEDEKPMLGFGLGNLVQGVTKLVETTSNKTLDTLETIGKKTMEVLQENDPGLKKKRAFLKLDDDKPILSQVLREAKEKAEQENKELEKKHFARRANYETLFDDHQGLVHLEALEMLSKQCDIKLQSLLGSNSGTALTDMQETLDQVKELCELPEEDEEETLTTKDIREKLESAVEEININISYSKLLTTWQEVEDWLAKLNLGVCSKNELHQQAIEALAQITALAVEQFHKTGELLLIKDHRSTADEADSLVQLTATLTALIGNVAARFSEKLNMVVENGVEKEEINGLITNVFFEAANSSSYIQDAFQLLIPVLQVGAV